MPRGASASASGTPIRRRARRTPGNERDAQAVGGRRSPHGRLIRPTPGLGRPPARGSLGVPRAALFPGLARRQGPVQADRCSAPRGRSCSRSLTMVVFTVFFGRLAKVGSDGLPYPLFSFAGLLPWTLFAQGLTQSSEQPRRARPTSSRRSTSRGSSSRSRPCSRARGLRVALRRPARHDGVLRGRAARVTFCSCPCSFCSPSGAALGVGMWLSALNVQYRDVRYVVPFFVQIWLFVTPVIYPGSRVVAK